MYIEDHEDYDEPGWYLGRVEYRSSGYYFLAIRGGSIDLRYVMKAARRTNS
ncbi:hypothetical protein LJE72_24715 [Desulfosporosinus sp. SRJS8]|nr:hypothetical protein [Desulfosporosinus sp. SRJS8]